MSDLYTSVRATVDDKELSRVETNQRALIDKILARYATVNAVYRELLQNSNDANATTAEIQFTVDKSNMVTQVVYKNNGMPFRGEDWSRLKKIAEGNPDPRKVGAFGVGAYTMFSICEEPLVISGKDALAFVWRGDALYTQTADQPEFTKWTSFVLPSRDPYPLPSLDDFTQFLCASLTFTKSLKEVRVMVNGEQKCMIVKVMVQEPRIVEAPKSKSSWWGTSGDTVTTSTPLFSLTQKESISETVYRITVNLEDEIAFTDARIVSAVATCKVPSSLKARIERVTKKSPPKTVNIELFLNAHDSADMEEDGQNRAQKICQSLAPAPGAGRIFIGFPTSQTTGLAAHVSAPFAPTVEREAMDLQDVALRQFNMELLRLSGIVLRLTLDHTFAMLQVDWMRTADTRKALEAKLEKEALEASEQETKVTKKVETKEENEDKESDRGSSSRSIMGFARFMAKSATKTIVSVVNSTVEQLTDGNSLLNPPDPRPLCKEERLAILLMQSYCPQPSTPDYNVGTSIAEGFSDCNSAAPPVLTKGGVVRGDQARLPYLGMQAFCGDQVVRKVVFDNCREYHTVIAECSPLSWSDLMANVNSQVLDEAKAVRLIQWWTKYSRADKYATAVKGLELKEAIRIVRESDATKGTPQLAQTLALRDFLFYVDQDCLLKSQQKYPSTVLPQELQSQITVSTLKDASLHQWFEQLPIEIWADYVCNEDTMTKSLPAHHAARVQILTILHQTFQQKYGSDRAVFGDFVKSLVSGKPCIPFDSDEDKMKNLAGYPSDLYLYSAELKAFEGLGVFRKVSQSLKTAGITEEFLLALGVRKSVAIDFLFTSLDSLKWSDDPKPLIEYLRTATLTRDDAVKLTRTRYLPAENDTKTYAPSELYLPSEGLRALPFVKLLQWPSEPEISERSVNGRFLVKLGVRVQPTLVEVLAYLSEHVQNGNDPYKLLDFLTARLEPRGAFYAEYSKMPVSQRKQYRILPCTVSAPFNGESDLLEHRSPVSCYSDSRPGIMAFPVITTKSGSNSKRYGQVFQCESEPDAALVAHQLVYLVDLAKRSQRVKNGSTEVETSIEATFAAIFEYLSHRCSDFSASQLNVLKEHELIPCRVAGKMAWFKPEHVFFRRKDGESSDFLTEELFQLVDFSPFLAAIGVKQEASTKDLFQLMIKSPQKVLEALGSEDKYRGLLRRIAANPPFNRVTPQIKKSAFLLAYKLTSEEKKKQDSSELHSFELAKAEDIFVVDNSFFGRMFPVKRAPHESDLEDFYVSLGSRYISKSVERRFEVCGKESSGTALTDKLSERVLERSPLLVSPNITSRPLVSNASSIVDRKNLDFVQAPSLMAVYSLGGTVRRSRTTCFSRKTGRLGGRHAIYVTENFDWFDVGFAIGDIILQRCQLEDAFFISSLLEAPLEQLRTRGFPVDRILKTAKEVAKPVVTSRPVSSSIKASETPKSVDQISKGPESTKAPGSKATIVPPPPATKPPAPPQAQPPPPPPGKAPATLGQAKPPPQSSAKVGSRSDIATILKQMFPDADEAFIQQRLGPKANVEDVRSLAEEMATKGYPKNQKEESEEDEVTEASHESFLDESKNVKSEASKKPSGLRKKLGKALGLRGQTSGKIKGGGSGVGAMQPPTKASEERKNVPPAEDAESYKGLENVLKQTVKQSSNVDRSGIHSPETKVTSVPSELDQGDCCEVIPAQSLVPFPGPRGDYKTVNGIRTFGCRGQSLDFLTQNTAAIENFSVLLDRLAHVFEVPMKSMAIYHDPDGSTIAFNSGRALHFNLRFFYALHYVTGKMESRESYSYWYVTMAHELAHHLVSAHNKEHGFYTESYVGSYLPKFVELLQSL